MKLCRSCKSFKPLSSYTSNKKARDKLQYYCNACRALYQRQTYSTVGRLAKYAKDRYGITAQELTAFIDKYLATHGLRCQSCNRECDTVGTVLRKGCVRLVVDHCHKTGKLRGMLCDQCNTALGNLGDNAEGVRDLLAYIDKDK